MEFLSNIELYYTKPKNILKNKIILDGDDFYHAAKVMRHRVNDTIFVTNGLGKIYECEISNIKKDLYLLEEKKIYEYENKFENVHFCIPRLKNADRFEFALEKCIELGITSFIIYEAEREVARGNKIERWNKIAAAAMKQSLNSFLPKIVTIGKLSEISKLEGNKYVFEQNGKIEFKPGLRNYSESSYFIFGPEGGLSEKEIDKFSPDDLYKLKGNRLRSETAIIMCASLL